jgi:NAD(P)-dependent dehydrogenase (short-subunit alcohol dehydrogenase family)
MDYQDRHVVVTGGTGALGTAVVGALLRVGAVCHVAYRSESDAKRFPHADSSNVSLVAVQDLADETAVTALYGGYSRLWASIHIAGAFAQSPIAKSDKALLLEQLTTNLVSAYVCSRAAIAAFARAGTGGRIVNVAARQALEPRLAEPFGRTASPMSRRCARTCYRWPQPERGMWEVTLLSNTMTPICGPMSLPS